MKACATLAPHTGSSTRFARGPVVFIDGCPESRLNVQTLRVMGPLDERTATMTCDSRLIDGSLIDRWLRARCAIASPMRLVDDTVKWIVHGVGKLSVPAQDTSIGIDSRAFAIEEQWTQQLNSSLERAFILTEATLTAVLPESVTLGVGSNANRSEQTHEIAGREVYVPIDQGQTWTVGQALSYWSAVSGLDLVLDPLATSTLDEPLVSPVALGLSVRDALMRIIHRYGLSIRRMIEFVNGRFHETRTVTGDPSRNKTVLPGLQKPGTQHPVMKIERSGQGAGSRQWVARAQGWRVEGTFNLAHGWDPSLEGQSDATYSRSGNSDFETYRDVYRLWVLNEDGAFSGEPFDQPAFDIQAFFGSIGVGLSVPSDPLRLLPCVTLDTTGRRKPFSVEVSTDAGSTWASYDGSDQALGDRAGVYLDSATLPAAFLAAAQAGDARVRVTASLRSPLPVEVSRWVGNPFIDVQPVNVIELGSAFVFERIDPTSIHRSAVTSGALGSLERDDTPPMTSWLTKRVNRDASVGQSRTLRLTLSDAWPTLLPGDVIHHAAGPGLDANTGPQAINPHNAVVASVRTDWLKPGSRSFAGPITVVEATVEDPR
ncbi:MAG: hypothetical protein GC164_02570 [Phycisphaera sp.]|nr:hypothetical protein [Phycisphaera sp.]